MTALRPGSKTNTAPGLIYMLNAATQRSYTDPFDTTKSGHTNRATFEMLERWLFSRELPTRTLTTAMSLPSIPGRT